jgi:hypothetical protein
MTRRWLVLCISLSLATSLTVAAFAQAPSLADKLKQLRRDWSASDDEVELTLADEYQEVAPPRAGSAHGPAGTAGQGGLPQIEPRSLMPQNMFGRDVGFNGGNRPATAQRGATRQLSSPGAVTNRPVARKSPTTAPATPQTQNYSTARRSPAQRPFVDVNPEVLHDELTGTKHPPAAAKSPANTEDQSPTILDDFAAGLSKSPVTPNSTKPATPAPVAAARTKPAADPTSTTPITLPTATESRYATPEPDVAEPEPAPTTTDDRYKQPSFPTVGKLQDRPTATNSDSGRALIGKSEDESPAAKAFQYDSIQLPTTSSRIPHARTPQTTQTETSSLPVAPRDAMTGDAADARRESFIKEDQDEGAGPGVLVTNVAPAITSDIRGPKQISIGREASYRVRLQNQGGSSAEAVVATVRIPSWAEVVNTTSTNGAVRQIAADDASATLEWQLPRLNAQSSETLGIDLVPRASRPLELAVTWTHDPVNTRTVVEVQEPKLKLEVTGPDEVLFNKSHVYRLTLSNHSTGV